MSDQQRKIQVGDLWWDRDHKWCDGSNDLDICYLVLSADVDPGDGVTYWKCVKFMWAGDGYCGASTREFIEDEIELMELVGSIIDIKSFGDKYVPETPIPDGGIDK